MKFLHRRKPRRFVTWFKISFLLILGIAAASLSTPYPAQLARALKEPAARPAKKTATLPGPAPVKMDEPEDKEPTLPAPVIAPNTTPWSPARSFSMPTIQLPPFPPALPERVETGRFEHLSSMAKGINLRSSILFSKGGTAAQDRKKHDAYQVKVSMELLLPHAANGQELLYANPLLPKALCAYDALMSQARVSRWYAALYLHKQNQIRKNAATLNKILDRHNFFDTDTILEITAPNSRRKILWLQADMDVVSDGSDGDRLPVMPEKIRKSDYYQPTTSYRWKKLTKTPNPLLARWQERLAKLQKDKKANNAESIAYVKRVIDDLKTFSFLLAEYDPFIVVPLVVQEGREAEFRPAAGDYAIVIVGKRVFPAIVGDFGPRYKSGEASLRLSKLVNPQADVYSRPVSDLGVSYIIFPGSKEPENGPIDYDRLNARCRELVDEIGGLGPEAEFVEIRDLLAPPVQPAAPESSASEKKDGTNLSAAVRMKDEKTALSSPNKTRSRSASAARRGKGKR